MTYVFGNLFFFLNLIKSILNFVKYYLDLAPRRNLRILILRSSFVKYFFFQVKYFWRCCFLMIFYFLFQRERLRRNRANRLSVFSIACHYDLCLQFGFGLGGILGQSVRLPASVLADRGWLSLFRQHALGCNSISFLYCRKV